MFGGRRGLVAVLAAASVVLGTSSASSGLETVTAPQRAAPAAAPPADLAPSVGRTIRTTEGNDGSGGSQSQISGDGHWQVFASNTDLDPAPPQSPGEGPLQQVFVRNLDTGAVTQLSVATDSDTGAPSWPDGVSLQPSISDNGRYVSFITEAGDVAPNIPAGFVNSLIVCDRDPTGATDASGNLVFDQRNATTGALTNRCVREYSGGTGESSVVEGQRPVISGDGTRVIWVRNKGQVGPTELRTRIVSDSNGLTPGPTTDTDAGDPIPLEPLGFNIFQESSPAISEFGNQVAFAVNGTQGEEAVLVTSVGGQTPSTTRVDVDPDNENVFLGDENPGQNLAIRFDDVTMTQFAGKVSFRLFEVSVGGVNFAGPRKAALALPAASTGLYVVTVSTFVTDRSQLVSRDNDNTPVPVSSGGMSPDGRFVAFTTTAPNVHDGAEAASGTAELVARDLDLDTARAQQELPRVSGALVTAKAPGLCANPTPPAINCASDGGAVANVSFDDSGRKVSFDDTAADLVPGDVPNTTDAFVRTWQPKISDATVDLGDVPAGDSTTAQVSVQVLSFGPVRFGPASITPSDEFTVEGSTCFGFSTFYAGDSGCAVSVRFAPALGTTGIRTADLTITSDQFPNPVPVATITANVVPGGPKSARGETIRTSVGNDGKQAGSGGDESMISGNGRWQVFVSTSPLTGRQTFDADPSDDTTPPNHENVFVRDLADPKHTIQISLHSTVAANPAQASRPRAVKGSPTAPSPDDDSFAPSISSNGRFVSFFTSASDVVPYPPMSGEDTPQEVLVVCDRDPSGAKDRAGNPILDRVRKGTKVPDYACFPIQSGSLFSDGAGANIESTPRLSGDGTRIAWVESIDTTNERVKIATISATGGALHAPQSVTYVPSSIEGFQAGTVRGEGDPEQVQPELTEDGNTVVYWARVRGDGPFPDRWALIRTTLPANVANHQDTRLDTVNDGDSFLGDAGTGGFGNPDRPAVSDDGSRVAFALRGAATDAPSLVYVVTDTAGTLTTVIASRNNRGTPADGTQPALSGDGRYLAFVSGAPNMHNGVDPPNGDCDGFRVGCQIVARDLVRDEQVAAAEKPWVPSEIVSSTTSTDCVKQLPPGRLCASRVEAKSKKVDYGPGSAFSQNPSVDATGSEISFDSDADDLVPGDTNEIESEGAEPATDAFVHTWRPTLDVPAMNFGSVKVGKSKTRTFTIRMKDLGGSPANFGPISLGTSSITGTAAGDYRVVSTSCTGRTLHEGAPAGQPLSGPVERCKFKIRFTPSRPGTRPANLQTKVGKNGYPRKSPDGALSYDPAIDNALTGFGATPVIAVTPATVDFGNRRAKDPLSKTVTVTNTGSTPLVISGVTVTDSTHPGASNDYTVDFSSCLPQVAPGSSCTVSVTFSGSRVGARDAVLVITSNANPTTTPIGLKARVLKPSIDSNPAVSPVRRVITVTGTNFAPNHEVEVGFDDNVQDTVKANAHGSFTLTLVVLPNGRQGPRTLFGHSIGLSKTIRGEFDFLVVLGSSDPGIGVITRD